MSGLFGRPDCAGYSCFNGTPGGTRFRMYFLLYLMFPDTFSGKTILDAFWPLTFAVLTRFPCFLVFSRVFVSFSRSRSLLASAGVNSAISCSLLTLLFGHACLILLWSRFRGDTFPLIPSFPCFAVSAVSGTFPWFLTVRPDLTGCQTGRINDVSSQVG